MTKRGGEGGIFTGHAGLINQMPQPARSPVLYLYLIPCKRQGGDLSLSSSPCLFVYLHIIYLYLTGAEQLIGNAMFIHCGGLPSGTYCRLRRSYGESGGFSIPDLSRIESDMTYYLSEVYEDT